MHSSRSSKLSSGKSYHALLKNKSFNFSSYTFGLSFRWKNERGKKKKKKCIKGGYGGKFDFWNRLSLQLRVA